MRLDYIEDLGTPEKDFFDQNPLFKILPYCRRAINDFGKNDASKYAWAIILLFHPKSPFHRLDDKVEIISKQYLESSEIFNIDELELDGLVEELMSQMLTPVSYELSLNINAIKKARDLVFNSTKSSDIMKYIESTPKTFAALVALQNEANNPNKSGPSKKFAGAMATATRPAKIVEGSLPLGHDNDD